MSVLKEPETLFVYGTLRRNAAGECHPLLAAAVFIGLATFPGRLYLIDSYPGALAGGSAGALLKGELYRLVDLPAAFAALDAYEEADTAASAECEYHRQVVTVTLADGSVADAWIYLYNRPVDGLTRVVSGDFIGIAEG